MLFEKPPQGAGWLEIGAVCREEGKLGGFSERPGGIVVHGEGFPGRFEGCFKEVVKAENISQWSPIGGAEEGYVLACSAVVLKQSQAILASPAQVWLGWGSLSPNLLSPTSSTAETHPRSPLD